MKAEDINIAIEAVNKFMFHSWNFKTVEFVYRDYMGEAQSMIIPRFLKEAGFDGPTIHFVNKWIRITEEREQDAWMPAFYAQLDGSNRRRLIEWVMKNYDGEHKIN